MAYGQVARSRSPEADAALVVAVRHAVGPAVILRADANRRWNLQEAITFGQAATAADLQVNTSPVSA